MPTSAQVLRKNLAVTHDNGAAVFRGSPSLGTHVLVEGLDGVNRVQIVRADNGVAVGEVSGWSNTSSNGYVEVARLSVANNNSSSGAGQVEIAVRSGGVLTTTVKLDHLANVALGKGALATSATDGFVYVPTVPGTPTGVPTSHSGLAPVLVDTASSRLWMYSGGAWVAVGAPSDAQYLALAASPSLPNERVFSPAPGVFSATDGGAGGAYSLTIAPQGVARSMLVHAPANSVLGNATGSTAVLSDLVAGTDGHYLRRVSGAIAWGGILDAHIPVSIARVADVEPRVWIQPTGESRFFFVDPIGGNDANVGYVDAPNETTWSIGGPVGVPVQTIDAVMDRLDAMGAGRKIVILVAPRADGSTLLNQSAGPQDLPLSSRISYGRILVRGSDLSNSLTDKQNPPAMTVEIPPGNPNGDGSWTATGAGAGYVDVAVAPSSACYGKRMRFVTGALAGQWSMVVAIVGTRLYLADSATTAATGNRFLFEQPKVALNDVTSTAQSPFPESPGGTTSATSMQLVGIRTKDIRSRSTQGLQCSWFVSSGVVSCLNASFLAFRGSWTDLNNLDVGVEVSCGPSGLSILSISRAGSVVVDYTDSSGYVSMTGCGQVAAFGIALRGPYVYINRCASGATAGNNAVQGVGVGALGGNTARTVLHTQLQLTETVMRLRNIEFTNLNVPCVKVINGGGVVQIDGAKTTFGGCTDVIVDLADSRGTLLICGAEASNPNTATATLGAIRLGGGETVANWAQLDQRTKRDDFDNVASGAGVLNIENKRIRSAAPGAPMDGDTWIQADAAGLYLAGRNGGVTHSSLIPNVGPGAGSYSGGISSLTLDAKGRVTAIVGGGGGGGGYVTAARSILAGAGLTGGGDLSADRTISMPNVGPGAGLVGGAGLASLTLDAQGRVTAASTASYATTARAINAGAGLTGGGDLSVDRTISMPNVGPGAGAIGGAGISSITLDVHGRVTAASSASYAPTARSILAGAGLTGGGDLSTDRTISMPNVGPGAGSFSGGIASLSIDAHGRVTAVAGGLGGLTGSIAANQVAFGTGVNTIGGSSKLTFDNTATTLLVQHSTNRFLRYQSGALQVSIEDLANRSDLLFNPSGGYVRFTNSSEANPRYQISGDEFGVAAPGISFGPGGATALSSGVGYVSSTLRLGLHANGSFRAYVTNLGHLLIGRATDESTPMLQVQGQGLFEGTGLDSLATIRRTNFAHEQFVGAEFQFTPTGGALHSAGFVGASARISGGVTVVNSWLEHRSDSHIFMGKNGVAETTIMLNPTDPGDQRRAGTIFVGNTATPATDSDQPFDGGWVFAADGDLKWKGNGRIITTIAPGTAPLGAQFTNPRLPRAAGSAEALNSTTFVTLLRIPLPAANARLFIHWMIVGYGKFVSGGGDPITFDDISRAGYAHFTSAGLFASNIVSAHIPVDISIYQWVSLGGFATLQVRGGDFTLNRGAKFFGEAQAVSIEMS